jgi:hypothetical protein
MADWSQQFRSLLSSPLGAELISQLNLIKGGLQDDASNADSQESAYALTQQARGVIKAIEHLQFLSVVPTDEGGKVKN